jgi:hypothetical protein
LENSKSDEKKKTDWVLTGTEFASFRFEKLEKKHVVPCRKHKKIVREKQEDGSELHVLRAKTGERPNNPQGGLEERAEGGAHTEKGGGENVGDTSPLKSFIRFRRKTSKTISNKSIACPRIKMLDRGFSKLKRCTWNSSET